MTDLCSCLFQQGPQGGLLLGPQALLVDGVTSRFAQNCTLSQKLEIGDPKFKAWLAEIQETVTFIVEPDEWRKYYSAELSPLDAIAQRLADEEV